MPPMPKSDKVWYNGELVDWDAANVHASLMLFTTVRASLRVFAATIRKKVQLFFV